MKQNAMTLGRQKSQKSKGKNKESWGTTAIKVWTKREDTTKGPGRKRNRDSRVRVANPRKGMV